MLCSKGNDVPIKTSAMVNSKWYWVDQKISRFLLELRTIPYLLSISLFKNYFECLFVCSESSLQSSNVCFQVCSDNVR